MPPAPLPATSHALRALLQAATRHATVGLSVGLLGATAFGFLIAGSYMWLATALPPPAAAILLGLLLLAAAALVYGMHLAHRARRVPPPDPVAALATDVLGLIRANPMEAVLLALTTGMSIGDGKRR